ncbi:MAG: BTAD domain-containing putative transcriptional regulator [Chloroflexota bacterium]|nr:BTAD domain-containing putative transcriptional regulator [Chloroflexota bacterium]
MTNAPQFVAKVMAPAAPPGAIPRQRLTKLLHAGMDRRLVIVTAPAGYGKTTLLAQFAAELDFPVCWLTLDRWDGDPVCFMENLVWAVRRCFPAFGSSTLSRLGSARDFAKEVRTIASVLIREMESLADYSALVLDDCQHLDASPAAQELLDVLIAYLPEHMHLVLASRTRPKMSSLPRLIASRRVTLLTAEDLRLTAAEAESLCRALFGPDLSEEAVRELVGRCHGWPAALVLTGVDMQRKSSGDQASGHLIEYLAAEVLAQQPPAVQEFLFKTSLLPFLRPDLCDSMLGWQDSLGTLGELARSNLVARTTEGAPEYRYHSLIQEFLRRRFAEAEPAAYRKCLVRAGDVLAEAGLWRYALECYCDSEQWSLATALLEGQVDQLVQSGQWRLLGQSLDRLPARVLHQNACLVVWRARTCIEEGRPEDALRLLSPLPACVRQSNDSTVAVRALTVVGIALRLIGKVDASLAELEQARSSMGGVESNSALWAEVAHNLGIGYAVKRDSHRARALLGEALALSERAGDMARTCKVRYDLGVMNMEQGRLDEALAHYDVALSGLEKLGNEVEATGVLNNLAMAHFLMADYGLARDVLLRAVPKAASLGLTRTEAYCQITLADVYLTLEEYPEAVAAYERGVHLAGQCGEHPLLVYGQGGLARLLLKTGQAVRAKVLLREALALAEEQRLELHRGLLLITWAVAHQAEGAPQRAEDCLKDAVNLLERVEAPLELCRARLHLANLRLAQGRAAEATRGLTELAADLKEWPSFYFLVPDILEMPALLEMAVQAEIGDGLFLVLSRKVEDTRKSVQRAREPAATASTPSEPVHPAMQALALGQSRVLMDGQEVTGSRWRSAKAKELFFFLACASRPLTTEEIVASVWPETLPEKGHNSFRCNLFRARRALYFDCVVHEDGYYRFAPTGRLSFDRSDFLAMLEKARRLPKGSSLRAECLSQALLLYRGPFLPEFYSEWCETERRQMESCNLEAMALLAGYYAGRGDFERAALLCEQILQVDPFDEGALQGALEYHARGGHRELSLRTYRRAEQVYRKELGCAPPEPVRDLRRRLALGQPVSEGPEQ